MFCFLVIGWDIHNDQSQGTGFYLEESGEDSLSEAEVAELRLDFGLGWTWPPRRWTKWALGRVPVALPLSRSSWLRE